MKSRTAKKEMLSAICNELYGGNMSAMGRALGDSPQTLFSKMKRGTFDAGLLFQNVEKETDEGKLRLRPMWLLTGTGPMTYIEGSENELTDAQLCEMCDDRGLHKDADGRWVKTQSVLIQQDVPIG